MPEQIQTISDVPVKGMRYEDRLLQIYSYVLSTLGGQTRMFQWLADEATQQGLKSSQAISKSLRSIIPIIVHVSIGVLGIVAIGVILRAPAGAKDPARPIDLAQKLFSEGKEGYNNFAEADRTEKRADSEQANMFYQKFNRDESTADNEWTRLLQSVGEVARSNLQAAQTMSR